jgi:hypothetical protein
MDAYNKMFSPGFFKESLGSFRKWLDDRELLVVKRMIKTNISPTRCMERMLRCRRFDRITIRNGRYPYC